MAPSYWILFPREPEFEHISPTEPEFEHISPAEPEFTRKFLTVSGLFTSSEKLLDTLLKMFSVHNESKTTASSKSGTNKHKVCNKPSHSSLQGVISYIYLDFNFTFFSGWCEE